MHRPLRLKAAKEREQVTTSPLNLPRSSFAAAVEAKNKGNFPYLPSLLTDSVKYA